MRNRKPTLKRVGSRYGAQPISWMRRVLQTSARTRALAVAATPHTEIVVTNASTTFHGYSSMRELGASCLAAVQGAAAKSISSGAADATLRSTTTAGAGTSTAGTTVFGWRLRVAGSLTNFNYRPVEVNVGKVLTSGANPGVVTIPTPILSLQLFARRLPLDVFILSVENAGGLATVSPGQAGSSSLVQVPTRLALRTASRWLRRVTRPCSIRSNR